MKRLTFSLAVVAVALFANPCHAQPAIVGAQALLAWEEGATNMSLPSGCQLYVYGVATGGGVQISAFPSGQTIQLQNANGNVSAELAVTTSSSNGFAMFPPGGNYDVLGGFGAAGFNYAQGFYGVNPGPGPNLQASVQFALSAPAMVAVIGMCSSQKLLTLSGLSNPTIDVPVEVATPTSGDEALIIAHEYLSAGTYTIQETTAEGSVGPTYNNEADLVGVLIFSTSPNVASSSNPTIPIPPSFQAQPILVGAQALLAWEEPATSMSVPLGSQLYVYGAATGGGVQISAFTNGQAIQLTNANGNVSAELAVSTSSSNSFAMFPPGGNYNVFGGFGVCGVDYAQGFYGVNPGPGPNLQASVQFTLSAPATVAVIGMCSSQKLLTLSGLGSPTIDVPVQAATPTSGDEALIIAHQNLPPGTYTIQETTAEGSVGPTYNNEADLIGVLIFSTSPNAASSSNPEIPIPPSVQAPPIVNIQKAVYVTSTNLLIGFHYQLHASSDLINWTNQGSVFTATNSNWQSATYWNVDDWSQLFFQLQVVQ